MYNFLVSVVHQRSYIRYQPCIRGKRLKLKMGSFRRSWIIVLMMSTNLIALVVLVVQSARASLTDAGLHGNNATLGNVDGNFSAIRMNTSLSRLHTTDVRYHFQNDTKRINVEHNNNKETRKRVHGNDEVSSNHGNNVVPVVTRQQSAVTKLRDQFKTLFEKPILEAGQSGKYLIYKCDDACNSRNQFHQGLISSFVIALLSNRQLKVVQIEECSALGLYHSPVMVPWKNTSSVQLHGQPARVLVPVIRPSLHTTAVFKLAQEMPKIDFEHAYTQNLLFHTENYNWLLDLRRNINTYRKFPWMPSLSISDIIRLVYTGLFQLPDHIQREVRNTISEQVGPGKLLCYFGNLPKSSNYTQLSSLIEKFSDEYTYYANTIQGRKLLKTMQHDSKIITLDHVRNIPPKKCNKDFILDLEVATYCDVLITTEDLNGVLGAVLRSTSKDLYCVSRSGEPYECTRNLVTGSFRTDLPEKIDHQQFYKIKL